MTRYRPVQTVILVFGVLVNFTQPLWVDATPVYPPLLGPLLFGPVCLLGLWCIWRNA